MLQQKRLFFFFIDFSRSTIIFLPSLTMPSPLCVLRFVSNWAAGQLGEVLLFAAGRRPVGALLPPVSGAQLHQFRALRGPAPTGACLRRRVYAHAFSQPTAIAAASVFCYSFIIIVVVVVVVNGGKFSEQCRSKNSNNNDDAVSRCCLFFSVFHISSSASPRSCFGRRRRRHRRH